MMMKKVKKLITIFMAAALTLGAGQMVASAAEDYPLADMQKTIAPKDTGLYNYNGWVTLAGAPADAKYLQIEYTGDITTLRLEFQKSASDDSNKVGPLWFDPANEGSKFVNANGGDFALTGGTVTIDLAASGINIADYATDGGIHLHYGGADESPLPAGTNATITSAKLTGGSAAGADSSNSNNASASSSNKGAAKTGSTALPTAIAGLVILGAGAGLVYANRKKTA